MRERVGRANRAARLSWCLGVALAMLLTGCRNPSPYDHTRAGFEATAKDIVANLEAGAFRRACEDLTSEARLRLTLFPAGGCSGTFAFARGLLVVDGGPRLGQLVERQLRPVVPKAVLHGDEARAGGVVIARFEQGRWGFETIVDAPGRRRLKADVEAAIGRLRGDSAERLLGHLQLP
jgi:hypothetical protein